MSARVALVTGGARGIGAAACRALCDQGAAVAVADLRDELAARTAAGLAEAGHRAVGVALDVTDAASVAAAVAAVREDLGAVDILVNNAGWDELRPFVETDEAFWQRIVDVNYLGALRVTREVLPAMIDRGWGRIVFTASDAGRVGSSLESVYAGAKGGVIAFAKSIARETARAGVTANAVCPGPTQTALLEEIAAEHEDAAKVIAAMTRAVPMQRLGQPEDVAAAVAFFCSEHAGFITGQTLSVSGGLTMA
jgi:2-hydroxycyclohexanecarboxyl-CoA dehydrogenase